MKKYFDCKTKEELFAIIRQATREGYFFRVENYYQGGKADRSGYMLTVLGHKTDS